MSGGEGNPQANRARPLSAGLWTLFSWLRGEEYGSSESLSSVGSDRTAASFAFVPHTPRRRARTPVVTPPSPRTDSYRRRVHDRSLRRVCDRELTLHRKYGLYQSEVNTLPFPRREESAAGDCCEQRERRAASEGYRRRSAHVPGKRPAPPPPSTFPKSHSRKTRKRRAPLPPENIVSSSQINVKANKLRMNPNKETKFPESRAENAFDFAEENSVKKIDESKDIKPRLWSEKSFLKNIFENKKRNSTGPIPNKFLPNISELDREAAEIMKSTNYRALREANDKMKNKEKSKEWICTSCLRTLTFNILSCPYCLSENKAPSVGCQSSQNASSIYTQTEKNFPVTVHKKVNLDNEDKEKLKEMLKEMKNSFPKRRKQANDYETIDETTDNITINASKILVEAPTLRIGTKPNDKVSAKPSVKVISSAPLEIAAKVDTAVNRDNINMKHDFSSVVVVTKPTVFVAQHCKQSNNDNNDENIKVNSSQSKKKTEPRLKVTFTPNANKSIHSDKIENKKIHTPLTISTLLNPETEDPSSNKQWESGSIFTEIKSVSSNFSKKDSFPMKVKDTCDKTLECGKELKEEKLTEVPKKSQENNIDIKASTSVRVRELTCEKVGKPSNISAQFLSQYAKRSTLISQLEQSIAKGDEKAAADAAAKLAQLRLSCSVLSFSSKIAGSTTTENKTNEIKNIQINDSEESAAKIKIKPVQQTSNNKLLNTITEETKNDKLKDSLNEKKATASQTVTNLKISEVVGPSTSKQANLNGHNAVLVEVWVEDREGTRGPLHLKMSKEASVGNLRRKVEIELGLAAHLQKWIVGRTLCTDDNSLLKTLAGSQFKVPFYLCIVEPDFSGVLLKNTNNKVESKNNSSPNMNSATGVYSELVKLEQQALISNTESFECGVCMDECGLSMGVVLRDCVHSFCRDCLTHLIRHCEEPVVSCPALGCSGILQEREIRALVSQEDYDRWLARGLTAAESGSRNAFHCRTRDCTGWALCETGVTRFPCPVCKHTNCIQCQAIHENDTCSQHRKKLEKAEALANINDIDEGTRALLDSMLEKGEALKCPECEAIITKKWGCDWVKCSACKTEICWITRGRRWGPNGKGDTSGGCRCGVDGKRCHPSCSYCH